MVFVMFGTVVSGEAQDETQPSVDLIVTALDERGVEQIYRIDIINGNFKQLTDSEISVEVYDISENVLAYISGKELHIIHKYGVIFYKLDRPQGFQVAVHISPNERNVSFSDESGLYILNIDSVEVERILEHRDFLNPNNTNGVLDGRYYYEAEFLKDSEILIIGIGLWEGRSTGFYNSSTQNLTELVIGWSDPNIDLQLFNQVLPLANGQILLTNYDGRCLPCGLWSASSIDSVSNYEQILDNADLTLGAVSTLSEPSIPTLVQRLDGAVRLFVQYSFIGDDEKLQNKNLVLELDIETNTVSLIMDKFAEDPLNHPQFSPDGIYLAFIGSALSDTYTPYGSLIIYDVSNRVQISLEVPLEVNSIRWVE